jgi:hypothetical protein
MTQRDDGHDYRDSKNKAQAYERKQKQKYEAIIDMIIRWLDANIDDGNLDLIKQEIASDSRDLKEKIELALDPSTTKKQIEDGDL